MNKLQNQNFTIETDTVSLQTLYFSQDNIVINANINYPGTFLSSDERCLLIIDNEFNTVGTIYGVPINWYSQDKNNFSGFQVVIPPSISNTLTTNVNYNLYVQFTLNGETLELPLENPLDIGLIHNSDFSIGQNSDTSIYIEKLTTSTKPVIINSGTATIIDGYWINSAYVLNVEIGLDTTISKTDKITLTSKNKEISIIGTNVSWYSNNQSTYNGAQIIITPSAIETITGVEQLFITVTIDSTTYLMPLSYAVNSNFETINNIKYALTTQNNTIALTKEVQNLNANDFSADLKYFGTPNGVGLCILGKINSPVQFSKNTQINLVLKDSVLSVYNEQPINLTLNATSQNWFNADNNSDYSSFQINVGYYDILSLNLDDTYDLFITFTIDGQTYEIPLCNNLNVSIPKNLANMIISTKTNKQCTFCAYGSYGSNPINSPSTSTNIPATPKQPTTENPWIGVATSIVQPYPGTIFDGYNKNAYPIPKGTIIDNIIGEGLGAYYIPIDGETDYYLMNSIEIIQKASNGEI